MASRQSNERGEKSQNADVEEAAADATAQASRRPSMLGHASEALGAGAVQRKLAGRLALRQAGGGGTVARHAAGDGAAAG